LIIHFRVQSPLPATGTAKLLEALSPFVPDDFINRLLPGNRRQGRQNYFSAAQLWRVHLLAVLTPAHSFNAVVRLLPEQQAWRRFARLDHRHRTPDVRMLCQFRGQAGVAALRRINEQMVRRLLRFLPKAGQTVAVIDATDLPASTADKKKTGAVGRPAGPPWAPARSNQDTPGSSSVIRNTPCVYGCAVMSPRFC
jgi:Transposase domain (DUF772)